jgi:hypothetical protein
VASVAYVTLDDTVAELTCVQSCSCYHTVLVAVSDSVDSVNAGIGCFVRVRRDGYFDDGHSLLHLNVRAYTATPFS